MKTLLIVRHGKSSWDLPGVADIDRPLLEKGILNNYILAEELKNKFGEIELVYSSPAIRAMHTAIIIMRATGCNVNNIQIKDIIYEGECSSIVDLVEETHADVDTLMVVGHNPTFTKLANLFLPEYLENLPTSGAVAIRFDIKNWNIIDKAPVFTEFDFPKKD
jgi:phosphohistidine phosphatase